MIKLRDNDYTLINPESVDAMQKTKWFTGRNMDEHPALRLIVGRHDMVLQYYRESDRDADYAMFAGPVDSAT